MGLARWLSLGEHPIAGTPVCGRLLSAAKPLPCKIQPPSAVHPSFNPFDSRLSGQRPIFAVDDEEVDRMLFGDLLRQSGIDGPARFFSSGDEMIDALLRVLRGETPPLACFIDVKMAGMSGFDVLRWIRCQDLLDSIPVIMLSSSDDPQKLAEARGVGAQCYAAKFPSLAELRAMLTAAQRYGEDRSTPMAFHLPCNLLLAPGEVASPLMTAPAGSSVAPFSRAT